jgi:hypothetical protein
MRGSLISQAEAWQVTIGILQSDADLEPKLFAATTLKGKVEITKHRTSCKADLLDYLRRQSDTRRCAAVPSRSSFAASEGLRDWAKTDSNSAMCLFSGVGYTNDGMERRGADCCFYTGQ